tara:strand:- start:185 stop:1279 length:1095 start_codon:yes stop_codon:yes gene_type:complete
MNFGAINKLTNNYIFADIANKEDQLNYICPDCKKPLILCKGEIKKPYFRHKIDKKHPCRYYHSPSESQIHIEAKHRLKGILENEKVELERYCSYCKTYETYEIPSVEETSEIILEYSFKHNDSQKYADIAFIDDNEIMCIFEICNTNKTSKENRPEPWFELKAHDILTISTQSTKSFKCIRDKKCEECIMMEELKETDLEKYVRIKLGQDYEKNPCMMCHFEENECRCGSDYEVNNFKPKHKRLGFDARDDTEENMDLCNIFYPDLNGNHMVFHSSKGQRCSYLVNDENFKKWDWWGVPGGSNGWLDWYFDNGDIMKYDEVCKTTALYKLSCTNLGTVDIIVDFIRKSKEYTKVNNCKYVKNVS